MRGELAQCTRDAPKVKTWEKIGDCTGISRVLCATRPACDNALINALKGSAMYLTKHVSFAPRQIESITYNEVIVGGALSFSFPINRKKDP